MVPKIKVRFLFITLFYFKKTFEKKYTNSISFLKYWKWYSLLFLTKIISSMFIFSPLEQFSINKIIPIFLGTLDFSITNSSLLVFISCFVAFCFYNFAIANAKLIPSAWQSTAEFIYEFIYFNVLSENVKKNGNLYFPMLFTIFTFIFFCNLSR